MKSKVSFDLCNNSYCEFYKNDFPNSIKRKPGKAVTADNVENSKNSKRNLKKKFKKKLKTELSEFLAKLVLYSPKEQKKEIKEYVMARNLSKEDAASLTINILKQLTNQKLLSRTDSKIDVTYDEKQVVIESNGSKENGANHESGTRPILKADLKFDFYQTAQEFVAVFYEKNVQFGKLEFIDFKTVRLETCTKIMELEFDKELEKSGMVDICGVNFKIRLKKLGQESISFKVVKNLLKESNQTRFDSDSADLNENIESVKGSMIKSDNDDLSQKKISLLPDYIKNSNLKEIGYDFDLFENVCGLLNPGIDCYIITIIQCLFSIKSFTHLLARGRFISEININNPLSNSKGQMAISLANVLTRMVDKNKPFVLTSLKRSIAKFWGLFDPYQQQDAEEILNFFLDTLHEELNNAPRTKYTPREDLPDQELADEFYKSHSLLNQSIIADMFQGFYKSKLSCPKCGHESRKFDPFMNLSIEVPAPPSIFEVLVVDSTTDLSKRRISIPVLENMLIKEMYRNILSRIDDSNSLDIIGAVLKNLKITHILDKEMPLSHYSDSLENVLYYLVSKDKPYVLVENSLMDEESLTPENFGIPFITGVDHIGECDKKFIHNQLLSILTKSIVKQPTDSIDLFDVQCCSSDAGKDAPYDLQPNSIIQIRLLWKSKELKDYYYEEDRDFNVINEAEKECSKNFSLYDCLRHFFQEETIEWKCEKCKNNVNAIKKLDLWSSPEVLIIHLKRFAFNFKYQRWIKHNTLINYPIADLDLSSFRIGPDQSDKYNLIAISNHMGSMDRGHYTAFGQRGSKWYHFDDEVVLEVKDEDLVGSNGYILFYQRKT